MSSGGDAPGVIIVTISDRGDSVLPMGAHRIGPAINRLLRTQLDLEDDQ